MTVQSMYCWLLMAVYTALMVKRVIQTTSTHGTGCAFSSALLARLVLGDTSVAAVAAAKAYVTEADAPGAGDAGSGNGPLKLCCGRCIPLSACV